MEITNEPIISLAKFVLAVLDDFPELVSMDGFDIQDLAEKHKLQVPQIVNVPGSEDNCYCAQFYSDGEMQLGVPCYPIADWLTRSAELRDEAERAGAEDFWLFSFCSIARIPSSRSAPYLLDCQPRGVAHFLLGKS